MQKKMQYGKESQQPKMQTSQFACEAMRLSVLFFPDCTWSHGRRDPGLLVRNPFLDERRVAENAPCELRHKETMEGCYPAERMAQKQNPVGECLPVVQFERRSPGGGHKPGWPGWWRPFKAELAWTDPNWHWLSGCKYCTNMYMWRIVVNWWIFHGRNIWCHSWHSALASAFWVVTQLWSCLTSQEPMVAGGQWSETEHFTDPWQHFLFAR